MWTLRPWGKTYFQEIPQIRLMGKEPISYLFQKGALLKYSLAPGLPWVQLQHSRLRSSGAIPPNTAQHPSAKQPWMQEVGLEWQKRNPDSIDQDARGKEQVLKGGGGTAPAPNSSVMSKRDTLTN